MRIDRTTRPLHDKRDVRPPRERTNSAPIGVEAKDIYSYGRQNWFAHVGDEHRACREAVALFDESSLQSALGIFSDQGKFCE